MSGYRGKRVLDLVLAVPVLIGSLPIQLIVGILVRALLGRPALFRQPRIGEAGSTFTVVKFRTMMPVDRELGHVSDASRMTPFGAFLRSTSLDELPNLWNVVRGDMSLVGPRPLPTTYLDRYTPEQARRHEDRPGLTGLAQVSGRNLVDWEERFRLDLAYLENTTLRGDLRILARSVRLVLSRSGVQGQGTVTMPDFYGAGQTPPTVRRAGA
jgi:lipopolysaccharide/colanic/teichoic acid biosynthesis glycosyltransferase